MCTYPENLVKIGPVYSEIIGLHGTLKNKTKETSAKHASFSTAMPGGLISKGRFLVKGKRLRLPMLVTERWVWS